MIEVLLNWLARLFIVVLIVRVVLPALFGRRRAAPGRAARPPVERSGGQLVRDPQCGTYLPVDRALRVGDGARAQYFCSTACRDAYLAAKSPVAS
jgi:uncharacterized protein